MSVSSSITPSKVVIVGGRKNLRKDFSRFVKGKEERMKMEKTT